MSVFVNTIMTGDCLDTLKTLPDRSVDCCVTSPPYYGLRDYGTAQWEGGDPNCTHKVGRATRAGIADKQKGNIGGFGDEFIPIGASCPHCGAVRVDKQIGLEETPFEYIDRLSLVFAEVRRVLKDTGTLWLNIGDSYAGNGRGKGDISKKGVRKNSKASKATEAFNKPYYSASIPGKSLMGIPWRLAFALQDCGWILRQDIIWAKRNVMPESVKDRFCRSHEHLFLFAKQAHYYFNHEHALEIATGYDGRRETRAPIGFKEIETHGKSEGRREKWPQRGYATKPDSTGLLPQHHGANIEYDALRTMRDVWTVSSEPSGERHYAMFPQRLIRTPILCGCPEGGIVLDPFMGSGTTAMVAKKHSRNFIGCEINADYVQLAERRIADVNPLFEEAIAI